MNAIEQALIFLRNGKLVAIPTETVYGLGGDARNPAALAQIYHVKGRPMTNPLIVHIPNIEAIHDWAIEIPESAFKVARAFWPGPLTLILKRHPSVLDLVTGGQETIALRIPNHPLTLQLLAEFNGGIAAPSANRYGRLSPTTAEHVRVELGDSVDYILDGGPCAVGIESTILDLSQDFPAVLRPGHISVDALETILKTDLHTKHHSKIIVPGLSESHYAPHKPLYLLEKDVLWETALQLALEKKSFNLLSFETPPFKIFPNQWITEPCDPIHYAEKLYTDLHDLDEEKVSCILVECPPNTIEWEAVRDRLQRAATALKPLLF